VKVVTGTGTVTCKGMILYTGPRGDFSTPSNIPCAGVGCGKILYSGTYYTSLGAECNVCGRFAGWDMNVYCSNNCALSSPNLGKEFSPNSLCGSNTDCALCDDGYNKCIRCNRYR